MIYKLGIWLDDPPRLVRQPKYVAALRSLPIHEVAIMLDGPEPGLADARWEPEDLDWFARTFPNLARTLTAWGSANRAAMDELAAELPRLLEALETHSLELDVEPFADWRERDVVGFKDFDGDGRRLDDAAAYLADVLLSLPAREIEVTTFPGALGSVDLLLEELTAQLVAALEQRAGSDVVLRLFLQLYAVLRRGEKRIDFNGKLGPVRFPREGLEAARARVPARVELAAGLAAYDTDFPGKGDTMRTAAESAQLGGAKRLRWWSGKHVCRFRGATARRAKLAAIARDLEQVTPAPAPSLLEQSRNEVLHVAARLKTAHPEKAAQLARDAEKLLS